MKTFAALIVCALLAPAVFAQSTPPGSALPPPGIHDPGVDATAPTRATLPAKVAQPLDHSALALPGMRDNGQVIDQDHRRAADGAPVPEVSVHQRGDDSVQEYRRNGQLYMVVVTPKSGVAQTYMVDPQGRVLDEHGQKPTRPVMYKVLEWGKSKPAEAGSSGG